MRFTKEYLLEITNFYAVHAHTSNDWYAIADADTFQILAFIRGDDNVDYFINYFRTQDITTKTVYLSQFTYNYFFKELQKLS